MIKILTTDQVREADQYTIKNEPISSLDLMERASEAFVVKFLELFEEKKAIKIFCGVGNNGGDGLAIGRLLKEKGWEVFFYVIGNPRNGTDDFKANLERSELYAVIKTADDLPEIHKDDIVVDGLFGSGLSRPVEGFYSEVINFLNEQPALKVSIDIASGLFADQPLLNAPTVFRPDYTLSFQTPKLVFFLPEYHQFVGEWFILDIGLSSSFIDKQTASYHLSQEEDMIPLVPKRSKYAHKNQVGRLQIVAGSKGMIGAAVLCTRAAFKAGAALIHVCVPKCGVDIMQISMPEAMVLDGKGANEIQNISKTEDTIAIGPGLGTKPKTIEAFEKFLSSYTNPLVIDADGLNILAKKPSLKKKVPKESILTPHPGEFKRLVGEWNNDFDKLEKLKDFCKKGKFNVVLKGAHSAICDSDGKIYFNPTGNPALATAGSGDVLTGILAAFLAQGLQPLDALKLGVYLHGKVGDLVVEELETEWITASDIINYLPKTVRTCRYLYFR